MTTPKPGPPKTIQAKPSKPEPAKREPFARRDILNFLLAHPNETLTLADIIAGTGRLNTTVASVLVRLRTDAEAGTLGIEGTIRGLGNGQYRYTPAPVTTTIAEQYAPGAPPETPAASNGHVTTLAEANAKLYETPAPAPAPPSKRLWEEFGVTSRGVILAQDENGALWKVEEIDL